MLNNISFHYTPAIIVSIIGAAITVAVTFGLDISDETRKAILDLAGLILGGIVVGGGVKSAGLFAAGEHPAQRKTRRRP